MAVVHPGGQHRSGGWRTEELRPCIDLGGYGGPFATECSSRQDELNLVREVTTGQSKTLGRNRERGRRIQSKTEGTTASFSMFLRALIASTETPLEITGNVTPYRSRGRCSAFPE